MNTLSDTDARRMAIAVSVCLRKEKKKICCWTKRWYKRRPQHTHTNLMKDLRLSRPYDYKHVVVGLSII